LPTYEYACTACGHQLEAVQSFSDDPLTTCEECGGSLRKVYGNVGIVFKGSGFYKTDSRNGSGGNGKGSSTDSSGGDTPTKTDSTTPKSDSGSSGSDSGSSSDSSSKKDSAGSPGDGKKDKKDSKSTAAATSS
jgi:putative FmdB family regulatory protein